MAGSNPTRFTEKEKKKEKESERKKKKGKKEKNALYSRKYPSFLSHSLHLFKSQFYCLDSASRSLRPFGIVVHGASEASRSEPPGEEGAKA